MLFKRKELEIVESKKRSASTIPEILKLIDECPSSCVGDVEARVEAEIAFARRAIESLNGTARRSKEVKAEG